MKKLLFNLLILFSASINAQKYVPFPTNNATWNVFYASKDYNEFKIDTTLLQYVLQGDTIINNITYKKVSRNIGTQSAPVYKGVGGLREENKKVFYIGLSYQEKFGDVSDGKDILLYDFNKQLGDTLSFHYALGKVNSIIKKIDSVQIGTEYRKRYNDCIIEGIGDVKDGLFGIITPIPTCICFQEWHLMCFSQNDETIYRNPIFNDCYSTRLKTSINEVSSNTMNSRLQPNPVKDYVFLQFTNQSNHCKSIEILDISGNRLKLILVNAALDLKLDFTPYSKGTYFIKVNYSDKNELHKIFKL